MVDVEARQQIIALLPKLRGFTRFLVRDPSGADDLLQEAVMRALAALAQYRPGTNLEAWLITIVRNTFYEQTRRRRVEERALAATLGEEEGASGRQEASIAVADLQRRLFRLSPLLREALVLVGAQELTYEDAAAICGVPEGTMKARVSRARRQLAAMMGEPAPPSDDLAIR